MYALFRFATRREKYEDNIDTLVWDDIPLEDAVKASRILFVSENLDDIDVIEKAARLKETEYDKDYKYQYAIAEVVIR